MFRPTVRFLIGPRPPVLFAARFLAAVILPPLLFFAILMSSLIFLLLLRGRRVVAAVPANSLSLPPVQKSGVTFVVVASDILTDVFQ